MVDKESYNKYIPKQYRKIIKLEMVSITQLPGANPVLKIRLTEDLFTSTVLSTDGFSHGKWYVLHYSSQNFYDKLSDVMDLHKNELLKKFLENL